MTGWVRDIWMTRKVRDIWMYFGKVGLYGGQTTSRRHEKKSHVTTNSMQNITWCIHISHDSSIWCYAKEPCPGCQKELPIFLHSTRDTIFPKRTLLQRRAQEPCLGPVFPPRRPVVAAQRRFDRWILKNHWSASRNCLFETCRKTMRLMMTRRCFPAKLLLGFHHPQRNLFLGPIYQRGPRPL